MKVAFILAVVIGLSLLAYAHRNDNYSGTSESVATAKCAEDDSCWNCHTMGNRICGPTVTNACVPVNTDGGVTQCAQPTVFDTALRACLQNPAYIGANEEDNRMLLVQCIDDYQGR